MTEYMKNGARGVVAVMALATLSGAALAERCNGADFFRQNGEDCKLGAVYKPATQDVCVSKGYNQDCGGGLGPRAWAYNKKDEICDEGRTFFKSFSPGADHVCPIDAPQNRCQPYASAQVAGVYGRAKFCGLVGK